MERKNNHTVGFITHECGNFKGHGGVAMYINTVVTQIASNKDYFIYVYTTDPFEGKDIFDKYRNISVISVPSGSIHKQGIMILNEVKKHKFEWIECVDYLGLALETLGFRAFHPEHAISNTRFITVHHTASRECFEWNEKILFRFANEWTQECYNREKMQMKLSDGNVGPSCFMTDYVRKNYGLKNVITIHHPKIGEKIISREELTKYYDVEKYENKFIISCISRVEGRKNQALLIDEFIKFYRKTKADAYLFIVGNESVNSVTGRFVKDELFERIPQELEDRILFFEFMDQKAKAKILGISNIFILASVYECLSLSLAEAVENGVPVMCSRYCGYYDYMGNTTFNMVFDPFVSSDLAYKIERFYKCDEAEIKSIIDEQQQCLELVGGVPSSINARLSYYSTLCYEEHNNESKHTLVINEQNYLHDFQIDDLKKYNSILVPFYFNCKYIETIKNCFERISYLFDEGSILTFGCDTIQLHFINILLNRRPFYISHISFDESDIGLKYHELIKKHSSAESEVFTVLNDTHYICSAKQDEPDKNILNMREKFVKVMISNAFYAEYSLDLEKCYGE